MRELRTMTAQRNALYVAGEWADATLRDPIVNPANGDVFAEAPVAGREHVEAALAAARDAFDTGPWPRLPLRARQAKMAEFLDAIERRAADIVPLIIEESGSLQMLAQYMQFGLPLQLSRQMIEISKRPAVTPLPVDVIPNQQGTLSLASAVLSREPVGVVVAITPYNVPFLTNVCKSVTAMLAGCTVILKPSPYTPFEALVLGEIADEVGLPKGVLNIVNGGADVGATLTTDKRVDLITFTGSDKVGAAIQAQAAPTLKRVVLELGGKSAMIVCADADLQKAAAAGLGGITTHCGQGCVLLTRQLVHNSIRSRYVETLKGLLAAVKVGDPNDASVTMGPLIREDARARTERYVEIAQSEGGRLVAGGKRPEHLKRGFYFEPTLFDDVRNGDRIAQEEVFGPLAVVIGFDTEDEAIALANASDYGLSGAVYSANVGRAYEIALQLRSGGVTVNTGFPQLTRNAPFGGIKRSGHGREYGEFGLDEFTYVKTIDFNAT
jgi:acyl-CoA reductase-like NAD-dependent aldehyde dehydrogenase